MSGGMDCCFKCGQEGSRCSCRRRNIETIQPVKPNKVWVLSSHTESGNRYVHAVFTNKPSKNQFRKFIIDDADNCDGPGDFGSYHYFELKEVEWF